jgi:hypothetical protein
VNFLNKLVRWWRRTHVDCEECGTPLVFGDNINVLAAEHWYCPNPRCEASELYP